MPSSIIDALLSGSTPSDEEKLSRMSDSLRQNKQAADLFSLSTIKPVSQAAVRSGEDLMTAAKRIGTLREARERREEAARLKAQEMAMQQERYAEEDKQFFLEQALKKKLADEKREATLEAARIKAENKQQPSPFTKVSGKETTDFITGMDRTNAFNKLYDEALDPKNKVDLSAGEYGAFSKGVVDIKNAMKMGLSPNQIRTLAWYNNFKRYYDAVARLGLFGSQFTEPEQRRWENMTINMGMSEKQVRNVLKRMREFIREKSKRKFESFAVRNVPEEALRKMGGDAYDFAYAEPEDLDIYGIDQSSEAPSAEQIKQEAPQELSPIDAARQREALKTQQPQGGQETIKPTQEQAPEGQQPVSPEMDEANKAVMAKTGKTIDQLKELADTDPKAFTELMKNNEDLWGYFQ